MSSLAHASSGSAGHSFHVIIRHLCLSPLELLSRNHKTRCLGNRHNCISIPCRLEFLLKPRISLDSRQKGFELLF